MKNEPVITDRPLTGLEYVVAFFGAAAGLVALLVMLLISPFFRR